MNQPIPVTTLRNDQPIGTDQGLAVLLRALLQRQQTQAQPAFLQMQEAAKRRQQEQEEAEAFVRRALIARQIRASQTELAHQPVVESPLYQQLVNYRKP